MKICTVEECNKEHVARGYCSTHYAKAKSRGEFTDLRSRDGQQGCLVEGCHRKHYARGYCNNHYLKWLRWGDTLEAPPKEPTFCECGEPVKCRGLCAIHYYEWYRNELFGSGEPTSFKKAVVKYQSAHERIKRIRGLASTHACVDCGNQASDWSLKADAVGIITEAEGRYKGTPYSLDAYQYEARCSRCHKAYDSLHANRKPDAYARGAVEE